MKLLASLAVVLAVQPAFAQAAPPAAATEVLVGTDTRPLSSFVFSKAAPLIPGNYSAETGGARVEAVVKAAPGGGFRLSRRFAEPGGPVATKTYLFTRSPDGVYYRAQGAWIRVAAGGEAGAILLLEQRSGVEGIPPGLWIHLSKDNRPKESPR